MYGEIPLRQFPVFIPLIDGMLLISDLVIATLLFAQASVFRSWALLALAAGYLFTALMTIPHAVTFPGAFAPAGLLGGGQSSTAWLSVFWRAGLPLAIGVYALLKPKTSLQFPQPSIGIAAGVISAWLVAIALTTLSIRGVSLLPPLVAGPRAWHPNIIPVAIVLIGSCMATIAIMMMGQKSRLDVWLLLSLAPWLVHLLLVGSTAGRFTLAWYVAYGEALFSHLIVTLALIAEASRTYAQLALSVAARDRERDARLMSMDAVASAIAHEVGQPLAAIATNAGAGLRWLDREPPNLKMAIESLRSNVEQSHRAADLVESIRSVLTRRAGKPTIFSLNELVRETAPLLAHDLARNNISLQLALDEGVPPITADRIQIQQVLINLITNAIQSLRATRGRPRDITIRSARTDGQHVLLDVTDNGIGITDEKMEHIFDAFFTTKANGTGLGLALCRTIVEKYGGCLWASQGEKHGATFHLQLDAAPVAEEATPNHSIDATRTFAAMS
jgi:signal transduction histidine kinase